MSMLGTGIASGVAQTAHNAQQVASQRDRARAADTDANRRAQEWNQARLRAIEQADEADAAGIRINEQVPEHEQDQPRQQQDHPSGDQTQPVPDELTTPTVDDAPAPPAIAPDSTLYRHVDVQA